MRILVVTVGSAGDVHPFVAVALALRERGHRVTVATNPYFAPLLEQVGLPLRPIGTVEQFEQVAVHPDLWHQARGFGVLAAMIDHHTPLVYGLVERETDGGDAVVVSHPLAFGARIANEARGVPLVTVHLSPASIWSLEAPPVPSLLIRSVGAWPRPCRRLVVGLSDRVADRYFGPGLNGFRARVGLPPVRHILSRWCHSPQRVIGLFPDWFAAPQPDWPSHSALTGFPLYDERSLAGLPRPLEAFLAEAEAGRALPVVFAPGSSNRQARRFFATAVDACRRLGRRGVLLTRYPEQLPDGLPSEVLHAGYAPFSALLPRAAALVHHGGIGTCAQALAAGVPQLVMPMTFDQPDNAARLERLGVSRAVPPRRFAGARVARELDALLASDAVARRCARISQRFRGADPVGQTCDLIETGW